MASFKKHQSIKEFQTFIDNVYALPDDRLYSIEDLLTHQQRFTMRALKGVRKGRVRDIKMNMLIAFAWQIAIANRLHIDLEDALWKRFPFLCSYCGQRPCRCKKQKVQKRKRVRVKDSLRPKSLTDYQRMFEEIYPSERRSIADAGVHLAEETGEVSEAVHNYLGEHKRTQFDEIVTELADYASCIFGLANSADIDIAGELARLFSRNCHVCHNAPCTCGFSKVAAYKV